MKITVLKGSYEVGTINAATSTGSNGKGSYTWLISSTGSTGSDYRVAVQSTSNPAVKDLSNNYFTITPAGTTTPSITVTSPDGGESWIRGSSHAITWTSYGTAGSNVKIELLKAGVSVQTLSASTPNDGTFSWTIPTGLTTGPDYRIRITSTSAYTDTSNNNFAITTGTTAPSITVTSPDGGESWIRGSSHAITWTSSGTAGSNVKIELLKAGVSVQTLSASTPNDGTFSWTIPTGLTTGPDYRIRITSTSAYTDTSNNNFAITTGTTAPSITITSPNGGEIWYRVHYSVQ